MKSKMFLHKETLPLEIPINFSNTNLKYVDKKFLNTTKWTIPMAFLVPKTNGEEVRNLSLPHPLAQIKMMNFIEQFDSNITSFCSLSPYSIRSPWKINRANYAELERKKEEFNYYNEQFLFEGTREEKFKISHNDIVKELLNYFSYRIFNNIVQFKQSQTYFRAKYKYDNVMNIDIKEFFNSIYTHSLEWAVVGGKSLVKIGKSTKPKKARDSFFKCIDAICMDINYNETNGIIIGPEFSRIISEVLLTRIDLEIARDLSSQGLELNKHYLIYRFIDDYTIFFMNPKEDSERIIRNTIEKHLRGYKLNINKDKYYCTKSESMLEDDFIIIFNQKFERFKETFIKSKRNKDKNRIISNFLVEFNILINTYKSKKLSLVRYALKALKDILGYHESPVDRQYLLDIAAYIFNYAPEYFSTQNLYTLFLKHRKLHEGIEKEENILFDCDEEIFNRIHKIIKQHINDFNSIYELLVSAKFLTKKIPSPLLCKILDKHKDDYFSICSVAVYILSNNGKVEPEYKIVKQKIIKLLTTFIEDYEIKSKSSYQDAKYFYLINDFNYYPGFIHTDRKIKTLLQKHWKDMQKQIQQDYFQNDEPAIKSQLTSSIMGASYYQWNCSYKKFLKRSFLKSANTFNSSQNAPY
ncbi:RNA-directed DNA polymerase [Bacillus cereus group sp. BfR-BA-01349]|uniref:RNA-directed DNA polymerase n=1 Tax=Bacillus cereus group sp. BfR-BA-01349 TaxID=2920312 RepID=UPI001F595F68